MKLSFLLVAIFLATAAFSQHFSIEAGAGLGGNLEKKFPDCNKKDKGRLAGYLGISYAIGEHYSIGLEGIASGRLFSLLGGAAACNGEDASTNTILLNNNNQRATTLLLRNKYSFSSTNSTRPYLAVGIGVNRFTRNVNADDAAKVHERSLVVSPEFGIETGRFIFACKLILGGKTASFSGFDSFSNQYYRLASTTAQQLYLTAGYQLFRF